MEWIILMQLVMGILLIALLQKMVQVKKQIDGITKEVQNYISYVTADTNDIGKIQTKEINEKNEEQNRLIQSILGEYFP